MTVEYLVALRNDVLSPRFEIAAASARWGRVVEWVDDLGVLEPAPPFQSVVLERLDGKLAGVQFSWQKELNGRWSEIVSAFGPANEQPKALDDWAGAIPYRFRVPTRDFPTAYVLLSATSHEGDIAGIKAMIVRRHIVKVPR